MQNKDEWIENAVNRFRKGASAMLEVRCALYSDMWENMIKKCA